MSLLSLNETLVTSVCRFLGEPTSVSSMASEDIAKLAETLAKTQVAGGQLSFKGKSLKLNTAEDGEFPRGRGGGALTRGGNRVGIVLTLPGCQARLAALSHFVPAALRGSTGPI